VASFFFTCAFLHVFLADFGHPRFSRFFRTWMFSDPGVIFLSWAAIFLIFLNFQQGFVGVQKYLYDRSFQEPFLAAVILLLCSTRPLVVLAQKLAMKVAGFFHGTFGMPQSVAIYVSLLWITPLLGSLLTEIVAMSLATSLFLVFFASRKRALGFYSASLGLLWVNVSIGGVITPYAAPCVLMVSRAWGWDFSFMMHHFVFKSIAASLVSVLGVAYWYRKELHSTEEFLIDKEVPFWVQGIQILFLTFFLRHAAHGWWGKWGLLGLYLIFWKCTRKYQGSISVAFKQAFQVGGFLTALIILNGFPGEEMEAILKTASPQQVYLGSIFLTSFLDNVVLTHLGTQIPGLSETTRYYLVAGGIVGGGLTLFANAPNMLGYQVLKKKFPELKSWQCSVGALVPTLIAIFFFWKSSFL